MPYQELNTEEHEREEHLHRSLAGTLGGRPAPGFPNLGGKLPERVGER
jgi:hypothetical protein